MKSIVNLSSKNLLVLTATGYTRASKAVRNTTSQAIVYTVLIRNSGAVNSRGKRDTWPATASGLNAPR